MSEQVSSPERALIAGTLRRLRDEYTNELPEGIVSHDDDTGKQYKVRAGWFTAVIGALHNATGFNLVSPHVAEAIQAFSDEYTEKSSYDAFAATEQDIARADAMITAALADIEKEGA